MSTITTTQIFQGVPLQKLQGLIDAGWEINGVSIQRSEEGKTRHGALTLGGMVLWWNQEQPAQPSQQDIPDILAGALGVSRGTAYDMMREALAEQAAPEGYKLVPLEPTDKMVQAAHHLDLSYMPGQEGADRAAIYRAMLKAAPQPAQHGPWAEQAEHDRVRELECVIADLKVKCKERRAQQEPSPTAGMNIAQRILHVGGRNNTAGYVEFGSIQAVEALVRQVLRDLPAQQEPLLSEADVAIKAEALGIDPNTPGLYAFYVDCISATPKPAQQEQALWAIFVPGPNEYHPAPSKKIAEHMAIKHNAAMAQWFEKYPDKTGCRPPLESVHASVVPWPESAKDHAEEIALFDYAAWGLTTPPQQPAQHEPVGSVYRNSVTGDFELLEYSFKDQPLGTHQDIYTSPPQRQPLTDDPLQGAVDWFLEADGEYFCTATVQRTLRIGYNRAKRLCDAAKERSANAIKDTPTWRDGVRPHGITKGGAA